MDMRSLTLKALLAWSVLLGVLPADRCVLKLAGVCGCEARQKHASDCCHKDSARTDAPLTEDHRNCCAFTPADGLVTNAPAIPTVSACDTLPLLTALQLVPLARTPSATRPDAGSVPLPPDTPLYLRTHAILV
jgi:hypothetical protein